MRASTQSDPLDEMYNSLFIKRKSQSTHPSSEPLSPFWGQRVARANPGTSGQRRVNPEQVINLLQGNQYSILNLEIVTNYELFFIVFTLKILLNIFG